MPLVVQTSEIRKLCQRRDENKSCVCVERKGDSGTWHVARDPEYSQMHINFQTRSHWTTVIQPQNGNKSAYQEFCHNDLQARWPTKSMDQGQKRRRRVCLTVSMWGCEWALASEEGNYQVFFSPLHTLKCVERCEKIVNNHIFSACEMRFQFLRQELYKTHYYSTNKTVNSIRK